MLDSMHSMTPEYLQLGEGALLRGVDLDSVLLAGNPGEKLAEAMQDRGCLIGATKAGCVFRCVPKVVDLTRGQRTPAAGEMLTGRWEVTLSGTLMEISPGNAAMLLNLPIRTDEPDRMVIRPEPSPVTEATERVCWVGSTGSGLLAIELYDPMSVGGMVFRPCRGGMGEMPFTLMGRKRVPQEGALPCRLLWMKEAGA